jgi:hypothetical protein
MHTPSANAKSEPGLKSLIAATTKPWRSCHLTYDQARYAAKEVRRALALDRHSLKAKTGRDHVQSLQQGAIRWN